MKTSSGLLLTILLFAGRLHAGDGGGDGIDDILIGASGGDPGGILDAGEAYVIFGSMTAFAAVLDLGSQNGTNGFRLDGADPDDVAGVTVSAAGDVDGDGFDDIIVGANHADPGGRVDAGKTYVVFGGNFTGEIETQVGNSIANTLTANRGSAAVDILVGKQGDDILLSDGGPDVLLGGEGNDIATIVSTSFRRVVGGSGTDTLKLAGSGITLDLSTIADSRLTGIEMIDIAGSGTNTLTLNYREVLNLSDESNTLIVRRLLGDVVNIGSGWAQISEEMIGPDTFLVFTQGAATVKVLVAGSGGSISLLGTTLTISGTALADQMTIGSAGTLAVVVDDVSTEYGNSMVTSINITGLGGNDSITVNSLASVQSLMADGGIGKDVLKLVEAGRTLDLTDSKITLNDIEGIDISGGDNNKLVISVDKVKAASSTTDTLEVVANNRGTIDFGNTVEVKLWKIEQPLFIGGRFTHIVTETAAGGTARVEIHDDRLLQNPLNRFDADRDGKVLPLDALRIINELRRHGSGAFTLPTNDSEINRLYFDVSGDNLLTPLDAMQIINAIARINRGGIAEGELRTLAVDLNEYVRSVEDGEKPTHEQYSEVNWLAFEAMRPIGFPYTETAKEVAINVLMEQLSRVSEAELNHETLVLLSDSQL